MRRFMIGLIGGMTLLVASACGGGSGGSVISASGTTRSLRAAGWQVQPAEGMPHTYTGVRQVAWFNVTAPDGAMLELQLLEGAQQAQRELVAAKNHDHGFQATVVRNVLVCDHDGQEPVGDASLHALRQALGVA